MALATFEAALGGERVPVNAVEVEVLDAHLAVVLAREFGGVGRPCPAR
jgi:hypothetical protein